MEVPSLVDRRKVWRPQQIANIELIINMCILQKKLFRVSQDSKSI